MNKKALLIIGASSLLFSCGGTAQISSSFSSEESVLSSEESLSYSEESVISDTSESLGPSIKIIEYGDLYPNSYRSVYAAINEVEAKDVRWESSNTSVVIAAQDDNDPLSCMLMAVGLGEAVITCYSASDEMIFDEVTYNLEMGEVIRPATYKRIKGAMRLDTTETLYEHDSPKSIEGDVYSVNYSTTIFEENTGKTDTDNHTDAYEFTSYDENKVETFHAAYVKGTGSNV
nr:hypothetical protein [Bacilli bacterium]